MDLVNGLFEAIGALLVGLNIRQLLRDGELKGVRMEPTLFFTAWGVWNLWFYPHLGQWISFWGGMMLTCVNLVWLLLVGYFVVVNRLLHIKS